MARISTYDQDSTLNKLDKVVGTDSATGATKNYTIQSLMGLINAEDLVDVFDGVSYTFKSFEPGASSPRGIINLNTGTATTSPFSGITRMYISALDKQGNDVGDYLDDTVNSFIRIVQKNNINVYGVFEVRDVTNYENGAYKVLTVISRTENGNIIANEDYFISNYSAVFDQDFSDDSITEFGDVADTFFTGSTASQLTAAGSGSIITNAERTSLTNFTNNGLLHSDVVDNVASTATNVPLSANQGKVLKDLINSINDILEVTGDDTLDELQEIVDFIKINKDSLDNLGISNIAGLQTALDAKQNTEVGKGLSANDFTTALLTKLNGIAAGAQVNVKPSWTASAGTDTEILNKPSDLTNLTLHGVTELNDVTSAGSGAIITSAERTKLGGIEDSADVTDTANVTAAGALMDSEVTNLAQVKAFDTTDYATAAQGVKADSAQQPPVEGAFVDGDKTKLDNAASATTTIEITGTANEIEVSPAGAQDLSANRTVTVGLPDDVTIGGDLKVNETIELVNAQSSTPTFDNGLYYTTEDGHDTLHFRYHGHDLSIDYLTENIPTGILNGGELSTNTNTTFDIAAGDGVINILNKDNSDPHPEIKKVNWAATTITHTLGNAGNTDQLNTWIYVDSAGTIQQTLTTPSPALWRSNIVIGSVIHSENVIRFVKTFPRPSYSNGNTFAEFVEIFGPLKKSGHLLTVNSTNTLALDRSAGISFGVGRNYEVDAEEPNLVSDNASTPAFHRYSSTASGFTKDDGTGGAGYASIDPTKYDDNGTLTTTSSGQYTVQRLFHFPNNTNVIVTYYGKAEYASIDEAEKNYLLENFQEADNTSTQAIYLGALVVKGNATDLGNSAQAKILTGGIFRSLSATNLGGVAVDAAINDLRDVNITGVANNQILQYNSTTGDWENGDGISGTGAANKLAIWSGADTLTNDTNLHWDTTNDRLGIGTTSPQEALDVSGFIQSDSIVVDQNSLFINSNQSPNVGMGTNSPSERLDVSGVVKSTGLNVNSNTIYVADSGTNVGIGTSTPNQKFHVYGNSTFSNLLTVTDTAVGINTQYPSRNGGLHIADSGIKISNSYGDMLFGQLYNHTDLRLASTSAKFYVSNGSSGPGGPGDTNLAPILVGQIGVKETSPTVAIDAGNATDAIKVPVGTTGERPTGAAGMFRYNTTDEQFEGYTTEWGAIAGSGGGSGEIVKETFSGTGSQATFTLADTIADIDNISVYVSGVYQYPSNYTVSGANVTFAAGSIPALGTDNVHVVHTTTVSSITEVGSVFVDQFTGNGTDTQFSPLGTTPSSENHTDVYIDGVYQQKNAYSIAGSQITFTSAPDAGAYIEVKTMGTIAPAAVNAVTTTLVSDSFTATADQTSFTLTNGTPSAKELTMVFVQGVYQAKANYSLFTSPIRIVLTEGAEVGEEVEVLSVSGANLTTSPVTSVNGQTGAVTVSSGVTSVNGQTGEVTVASTMGVNVISSDTTATANNLYVLTANLTLTLPASPSAGDSIKISNRSGVATCVLARNGSNIMGSGSDLTLDAASASFELIYSDATNGWVIIGQ